MSDSYHLRLACRNYDGTNAILRGVVKVPGIEVEALEQVSVQGMFAAMYRGEFDVSEMSLAELIYYTSRNKSDFIGVPVFPSRMFRHGFHCRSAGRRHRDAAGSHGQEARLPALGPDRGRCGSGGC